MNFEDAFEKVKNGTATEEEKAYVADEVEKIRRISEILDNPARTPVVAEADAGTVRRAKKAFNRRTTIRIIVITFLSLLLIAAIVCGIIFIPSISSAKKRQVLGREECLDLAKEYLTDYTGENADRFVVRDVDKELRINGNLTDAIFSYEIRFVSPEGVRYRVEVSTESGYVMITDINMHEG